MKKLEAGAALALALALSVAAAGCSEEGTVPTPNFDAYGGWTAIHSTATGRFRTVQIDGTWWLVTPDGNAFFSTGVNVVNPDGDYAPSLDTRPYQDNILARYGSEEGWRDEVVSRFHDLGVNTIGAWSKVELFPGYVPYTVILGFSGAAPEVPNVPEGITGVRIRDYFADEFEVNARNHAESARTCANDPWCIGVFTDNELGWGMGFAQSIPYVDAYATLPSGASGKIVLQAFFENAYSGDIDAFNAVWGQNLRSFDEIQALSRLGEETPRDPARQHDRNEFTGHVAQRYFAVAHDALRAVSPDLLILGARFMVHLVSPSVAAAAGVYADVVTINYYDIDQWWFDYGQEFAELEGYIPFPHLFDDLDEIYRITGKPILISEFGYRAADTGLANSFPPVFPILSTQTERAAAYESYMAQVLARPHVVGAHWFQHMDQPASGRFDGENNNWGLVNIEDDLYPEISEAFRHVNSDLYERRRP